jgi:hypothetical protein
MVHLQRLFGSSNERFDKSLYGVRQNYRTAELSNCRTANRSFSFAHSLKNVGRNITSQGQNAMINKSANKMLI